MIHASSCHIHRHAVAMIPAFAKALRIPVALQAALAKLSVTRAPSIHVIGATKVEDMVDWSLLCQNGVSILLVGPQVEPLAKMVGSPVVPRDMAGQGCVTVLRGLYSRALVRSVLGDHPAAIPDIVITFNADIYMHYWRRTLAELLQWQVPVVVTFYCEYEGREVLRLLGAPAEAFSSSALAECDSYIRKRYRGDADDHVMTPLGATPAARMLWAFEPNPHAHLPPQSCLPNEAGEYAHGVRNSYWMAFSGKKGMGKEDL